MPLLACVIGLTMMDRASEARQRVEPGLKALCASHKVPYPPAEMLIRAFKSERVMEIWVSPKAGAPMVLLMKFPIAAASGELGPKRQEGDRQVPEGRYQVRVFNPLSSYHLSMGLNYPNADDLKHADKEHPGSDIYIHGKEVSIGCLAMTDPVIEQIYTLASLTTKKPIKVDIFPFRMTQKNWKWATENFAADDDDRWGLWTMLWKHEMAFQKKKR